MTVGGLCSRRAVCVSRSATLAEVADLMSHERVGAVIVTAEDGATRRVVGIVTDRDIVRTQLDHAADLSGLSAADAMTERPLTLEAQESIDGALAHLRARHVRRAPLVGPEGEPLGLVSLDDLLGHLAGALSALAQIVARQAAQERP